MSRPGPQTSTEYMQFLKDTSWYKHAHENSSGELAYLALGLAGETGEFVDEVKKIVRETGFNDHDAFAVVVKEKLPKLINELGDVLWYFTRIMDVLGTDTQELQVRNTHKLYNRLQLLKEEGRLNMDLKWPFSDPFLSFDNVQETILDEEHLDVRID